MTPDKVEAALGNIRAAAYTFKARDEDVPYGDLMEALSVLTEALAERGWRPIESAPRDETQVLIFDPTLCGGFVCIARHWMGEWRHGSLPGGTMFPTHWQPLPEPPHDR